MRKNLQASASDVNHSAQALHAGCGTVFLPLATTAPPSHSRRVACGDIISSGIHGRYVPRCSTPVLHRLRARCGERERGCRMPEDECTPVRPPADNRLGDRPGSMTCRIPGSLIEACPSARPARTSSTAMQSPDDRQAPPAQRRVSRIAPGRRQRARIGLAVQSWDNEPARHVSKQARSRPARAALARLCARSPSEDTASCDPGSVRAPAQAP